MNIAGIEKAGAYLEAFVRSRQSTFREYVQQVNPNEGYGRYAGHDVVANVMRSIYHYSEEHFLNVGIPEDYASPKHLLDQIQEFSGYIDMERGKLEDAITQARTQLGHIPINAGMVRQALVQCRYAVDHALLSAAEVSQQTGSAAVPDVMRILEHVARRFHRTAGQLTQRHNGRPTLKIQDEYDVQDLFISLLGMYFDDIRIEEWTPSSAGSAARTDAFLFEEETFIEFKMIRPTLSQRKLKSELATDFVEFAAHPRCKRLFVFVYDPGGKITNPRGFETDMSSPRPPIEIVRTMIQQS